MPELRTTPIARGLLGRSSRSPEDDRTLKLAKYLLPALPPAPASCDWTGGIGDKSWLMYGNDRLGCCVFSTWGHLIAGWTATKTGSPVFVSEKDITTAYLKYTGGRDNGAIILDRIKLAQKGLCGHSIGPYAEVAIDNHELVKLAIALFGSIDAGFEVPSSIDGQAVWDVPKGRYSIEGGHSVPIHAYSEHHLWCSTWGELQPMTWAFWDKFFDEAWAELPKDWEAGGVAPNTIKIDELAADMAAVQARAK